MFRREGEWALVRTESGTEGHVPSSYLTKDLVFPSPPQTDESRGLRRKTKTYTDIDDVLTNEANPQNKNEPAADTISLPFGEIELCDLDIFGELSDSDSILSPRRYSAESLLENDSDDCCVVLENFQKKHCGKYLVLHSFRGDQEDDAKILKG